MIFETTCTDCGASYEIGRGEIGRGLEYWSRCPSCRGSPPPNIPCDDDHLMQSKTPHDAVRATTSQKGSDQ